jgi:hypothetical protein
MAGGRRPDFDVCVSERPTDREAKRFYRKVGSAWRSDKGDAISIKLDVGTAIVGMAGVDVSLFPVRDRDGSQRGGGGPGPAPSGGGDSFPADNFGDDQIPFVVDEGSRDGAR